MSKLALLVVGEGESVAQVPEATALLAALPMPVAVLDGENRFRFVNPAAEQFFGTSLAQVRHMALADLVPADSPIFLLIAQLDYKHSLRGPILAWHVVVLLYWMFFAILFDLDVQETVMSVAIVAMAQAVVAWIVMH